MQLNNNVSFKAVPGGQIKSLLAKNPEKLNEITQKLAPMGDKNSVVDIFYTSVRTQDNRNVKKFSLRLFNKVFGASDNAPVMEKETSFFAKDLLPKLDLLTQKDIISAEDKHFRNVAEAFSGSKPYREWLHEIMKSKKEEGIELGSDTKKRFNNIFNRF